MQATGHRAPGGGHIRAMASGRASQYPLPFATSDLVAYDILSELRWAGVTCPPGCMGEHWDLPTQKYSWSGYFPVSCSSAGSSGRIK